MKVWTAEQLRAFLAASAEDPVGPLYALLATTGMRRGEATGLRWQQVDVDQSRLLVDHQLTDQGYKVVLSGEPKSARGRRVLSLDRGTVALLRAQQGRQAKQRAEQGLDGEGIYVFTRPDGEP